MAKLLVHQNKRRARPYVRLICTAVPFEIDDQSVDLNSDCDVPFDLIFSGDSLVYFPVRSASVRFAPKFAIGVRSQTTKQTAEAAKKRFKIAILGSSEL